MKPLSANQQKILDFVRHSVQQGDSPSVREICSATGVSSTATVHSNLKALEERGLIERPRSGINRGIRLAGEEASAVVPIVGTVTAGIPILAVEDIEGYIPVSENIRRGRELFALRVMGESMINAGIMDNDIVVVYRTPTAENGEIVVAMIDDEATVKRFYKEDGHFRLQPENPIFEPIIVPECSILGKVISVTRYY